MSPRGAKVTFPSIKAKPLNGLSLQSSVRVAKQLGFMIVHIIDGFGIMVSGWITAAYLTLETAKFVHMLHLRHKRRGCPICSKRR